MADDEEVEALASLCIWHGSERGIAFFAFNKLMYHLIARCCEVSGFWKSEMSVLKKKSQLETNSLLQFDLTRTKTRTTQTPIVYAHKTSFLWDLYFALGMHLALESKQEGMLFPEFFKKLSSTKLKGKGDSNDSKSSKLWIHYYQEILELAKLYERKCMILSYCLFFIFC